VQKLTLPGLFSVTIVLSLFLIVVLTGLAMQSTTAQNTTSITPPTFTNGNSTTNNFLTYSNSSYGIKIQYPSYFIKEEPQNQSSGDIVKFSSPRGTPYFELGISDGQPAPQNMSLEQWSNATIRGLSQSFNNFSLIESNSTTVAGFPAHEILYTATLPSSEVEIKFMQLLIIKDNKEYIITANSLPTDFTFYLPTLQEMINSFVFIPTVTTPA
jgi:hypothetical protein